MAHVSYVRLLLPVFASTTACAPPAYFSGFERLHIGQAELAGEAHPDVGVFVQTEYWFDFSAPDAAELAALQPAGEEPSNQIPWVQRQDLEISVQWRLVNESDAPLRAWVTLDGATEFYDWNPIEMYGIGGGEDADEPRFPSLLGYFPRQVGPGQVVRGEFREDDLREAMYDLDVLTRFCGGPFAVLYNRSEVDPVGTEAVPSDAVMAGLYMLRLTLGTDTQASLEYSIRIRDRSGILYDDLRDEARYAAVPSRYIPTGVAQVPAGQMDPSTMSTYCEGRRLP